MYIYIHSLHTHTHTHANTTRGAAVDSRVCVCVCVWLCYATGGKRIFLEKFNFAGSWWSASRKSLKPHKYFVSSFRRWFVRFGLVALFADHLFLRLFFVSAFVAVLRGVSWPPSAGGYSFLIEPLRFRPLILASKALYRSIFLHL